MYTFILLTVLIFDHQSQLVLTALRSEIPHWALDDATRTPQSVVKALTRTYVREICVGYSINIGNLSDGGTLDPQGITACIDEYMLCRLRTEYV